MNRGFRFIVLCFYRYDGETHKSKKHRIKVSIREYRQLCDGAVGTQFIFGTIHDEPTNAFVAPGQGLLGQ